MFYSFILSDKLFTKALRRIATCSIVNNNLCAELVSSLELLMKFDGHLRITSVHFLLLILIY